MLEGQALVLSQVAEYKESSKPGSFTTLSSSLGRILMQLHTGMLSLLESSGSCSATYENNFYQKNDWKEEQQRRHGEFASLCHMSGWRAVSWL